MGNLNIFYKNSFPFKIINKEQLEYRKLVIKRNFSHFILQKRRMNKPFYGAASITCSSRSQLINVDYSQGPGSYDVNKQKYISSLPKWSLKPRLDYGSCFKISKQNKPCPGSYQTANNLKHPVKLKNPNYRSQKYKTTNQKIAHMSHLNLRSSINPKTGASFGFRDELVIFKETSNSPGPIYHVAKNIEQTRSNQIKNNCRGFGFGQRNGIYKTNDFVPGPGAYTAEGKQNKRDASPTTSTFGKSSRNIQSHSNPLGPGQYNPSTTMNGKFMVNSGRTFKLKGKLPEAQKYVNPNGPGTYDLPDTKNKVGPRFNHYRYNSNTQIEQINDLPSPFTYECKRYPEFIDERKGFSLGKKINSGCKLSTKEPGPGSYEVNEDISNQKLGGYMGQKVIKKKKINQEDCFGKYDPKLSASACQGMKYSFCSDPKPWNRQFKDDKLGPAHYQLHEKRSIQSYSMGTSQRFKQLKRQGGLAYRQAGMNSTIGYLPSYLRKQAVKTTIKNDSIINQ